MFEQKVNNNIDDIKYCDGNFLYNKLTFKWNIMDTRCNDDFIALHVYNSLNINAYNGDKIIKLTNKDKAYIIIVDHKQNVMNQYNMVYKHIKIHAPKQKNKVYVLKSDFKILAKNYKFICGPKKGNNNNIKHDYPACIIPETLYLGNLVHRKNKDLLSSLKITNIIDLSEFNENNPKLKGITYMDISINDHDDEPITKYFKITNSFINDAISKKGRVFVHCSAGISRSVTIILAYLMTSKNMNLFGAYQHVLKCRECMKPNQGFYKQLKQYELKLYGKSTAKQIKDQKLRYIQEYSKVCNQILLHFSKK